jgi:hypothetical protein
LHPLGFWPDHSGEKSPRPRASAFARSGGDGRGRERKRRRRVAHRPELAHHAVDDAARRSSGEEVGERGVARRIARQRGAMDRARRRLGAQQVRGADLGAGGAERHRGGDAPGVRDSARGDHRHANGAHDLRQQRERAGLGGQVVAQEHPAMAAGSTPCAMIASTPWRSSHNASSTVVADEITFEPHDLMRATISRGR